MNKAAPPPDYYDRVYADGGDGGIYDLPYQHSAYFPLFRNVRAEISRLPIRSVLEVGCGTGAFAHFIFDTTDVTYSGFDFSPVAVEKARIRTKHHDRFYLGDATRAESYERAYDSIVCTEVLEHIQEDLAAVEQWRSGAYCICSVPNFDADSHVRYFHNEDDVRSRYGRQIEIDRVARIRKPVLHDISWRGYARALRWYRYKPRELVGVLGLGSFDHYGGWFLFTGRKR